MKTQKAGCILINLETKKVALVARKGQNSFPKGHKEDDETIIECAIRETKEETNHDVELLSDKELIKIEYETLLGEEVETYFYLGKDLGETKDEIDEAEKEITIWVPFDSVEKTLSYNNLREMWNEIKYEVKKYFK